MDKLERLNPLDISSQPESLDNIEREVLEGTASSLEQEVVPKLDLTGFAVHPGGIERVSARDIDLITNSAGFPSRESGGPKRRNATGRTEPFSLKMTPEYFEAIYEIADQLNTKALAEVLELGVEALIEKRGLDVQALRRAKRRAKL